MGLKRQEAGIAHLGLVILIFVVLIGAVGFMVLRSSVKRIAPSQDNKTSSPTVTPTPKEYENPFEKSTQYSNPFEEEKNPFDYLNE